MFVSLISMGDPNSSFLTDGAGVSNEFSKESLFEVYMFVRFPLWRACIVNARFRESS